MTRDAADSGLVIGLMNSVPLNVIQEAQAIVMEMTEGSESLPGMQAWFTRGVAEETALDLSFHHILTLRRNKRLLAFLTFTSFEGELLIGLMATRMAEHGKGHGRKLVEALTDHGRQLGFRRISLFTVPPDAKLSYAKTLSFFRRCGFSLEQEIVGLWESGALKLTKVLLDDGESNKFG